VLDPADENVLAAVRAETLSTLRDAIGDAHEVAYLDVPNQRNVGDLMLELGTLAYLRSLGVRIRYMADSRGYDAAALRRAMPSGVVLIHAGGNFGDLWYSHQLLRERIATELPDYRIVSLPQSVQYRDPVKAHRSNAILGAHPDFTALVRDRYSLERARECLPDVKLAFCPDVALGYTPAVESSPQAGAPTLVLAREDLEAASGLAAVTPNWLPGHEILVTDWITDAGAGAAEFRFLRRVLAGAEIVAKARRRIPWVPSFPQSIAQRALPALARNRLTIGERLFAAAPLAIVDRLHAHVMATLLGVPHIILDNDHRKVGGVYDAVTHRFSSGRYVNSLDEARAAALEILEG
jgi:pyruvyl transferase EpsO